MEKLRLPPIFWLALLAAAGAAVGALLTWVRFLFVSVTGVQTNDGKLVLGLALLSAVLLIASLARSWTAILAGLAGLGALGVSAYDTVRVYAFHRHVFGVAIDASPGAGLWIDVIASTVLVSAIGQHLRRGQRKWPKKAPDSPLTLGSTGA